MRRTALVTGAGRGIGRAIVAALSHDADVAALDVAFPDPPGPEALRIEGDVTRPVEVDGAVRRTLAELGELDWVVCAAGITRDRVSWKMTDDDWRAVVETNLSGAFYTARAAAPALRASSGGRLVFVGSINGARGKFGQTNYAASKAGLVGLARSLALELARDPVTVNVVMPGFIDTAMTRRLPQEHRERAVRRTPLGRPGCPEEVAALVRFLCAEPAGFITGAVIPVDGGQLLGEVA